MRRYKPKYGPLFWLRDVPHLKTNWLLEGWSALDCAVIFGSGAQIKQKYPDYLTQVRLKWDHYSRRMKFLDAQDHEMAQALQMDWNEFAAYVRFSLIDAEIDEKIVVPIDKKRRIAWAKTTLETLGVSDSEERRLLIRDPPGLMKFAYAGLNAARLTGSARSPATITRLILMGIASVGMQRKKLCAFCFRWAAPSQVFCFVHGQGHFNYGAPSTKARNYHVGSQTPRPERWQVDPPIPSVYQNITVYGLRLGHSIYYAHLLWGAVPKAEEALFKEIKRSLKHSPHVKALIGNIDGKSNACVFRRT